jgi:cytochrome c-type biogenesis protein CcmH/NrfG
MEGLASRPRDPEILYFLAVAHFMTEAYEDAVSALRSAIDLNPRSIDALLLLALLYSWGYGDGYAKAPDTYRRILDLSETEVDAYIGLALTRRSPGSHMEIGESVELLQKALEIDPTRNELHNNLAYSYWEAGRYEEAEHHFRALLKALDPDSRHLVLTKLDALKARQKPRDTAYLGPRVPRFP